MEAQSYELRPIRPISHKEFNKFIKGKRFKGRNNYVLKDLKAKFSFKPLVERRALVVFDSMRKAAKCIGVGEGVIRYVTNNGRDLVKRFEDGEARERVKVFFIKWC